MRTKFNFFQKIVLFIIVMLCFYTGAKAQGYRLTQTRFQGNNNNAGLIDINRTRFQYNNPNLPNDLCSDQYFDSKIGNNWQYQTKTTHTYDVNNNLRNDFSEVFNWSGTSYAPLPNTRELYTYTTVGTNTKKTIQVQNYVNNTWQDESRIVETKNAAGKQTHYIRETLKPTGYVTFIEFTTTYNTTGLADFFIYKQHDNNTGTLLTQVDLTYTYDGLNRVYEEIEERKQPNQNGGTYSSFLKSTHSFSGNTNRKTATLSEQKQTGSSWVMSGHSTYTYNSFGSTEIQKSGNTMNNLQNSTRIQRTKHQPSGMEGTMTVSHWQNNAWLLMSRTINTYQLIPSQVIVLKSDNNNTSISIYPNPTTNQLKINNLKTNEPIKYYIYDMQGKVIMKGAISSADDVIEVNTLSAGTYNLFLQDSDIKPMRFVKQ